MQPSDHHRTAEITLKKHRSVGRHLISPRADAWQYNEWLRLTRESTIRENMLDFIWSWHLSPYPTDHIIWTVALLLIEPRVLVFGRLRLAWMKSHLCPGYLLPHWTDHAISDKWMSLPLHQIPPRLPPRHHTPRELLLRHHFAAPPPPPLSAPHAAIPPPKHSQSIPKAPRPPIHFQNWRKRPPPPWSPASPTATSEDQAILSPSMTTSTSTPDRDPSSPSDYKKQPPLPWPEAIRHRPMIKVKLHPRIRTRSFLDLFSLHFFLNM